MAHRGASHDAPENTLKAFKLALAQGAQGIELDTYQVEGQIVVIHDRWLDRTTNGQGMVTRQSMSYIRSLNAGEGESVPLLQEVLAMLPSQAKINIEIKHLYDAALWLNVLYTAVSQHKINEQQIIVSSFNHTWLKQLKLLHPGMQIGALTATYPENGIAFATSLQAYSLHIDIDVADKTYIKSAQDAGLKTLIYTVDKADDMMMLADWGVDGIFTNKPALADKVLNS
jgi:glycerophosphoryl diester phosphodiesterase